MVALHSPSSAPTKMATLRHYKNLVLHKAYADFRAEAERTYLGVTWWILEPLINMGIYYLVFGVFLGARKEGFIPYLLTGLVVWRFFDATVNRASRSILANMSLVRQMAFRKIIFPLIAVCTCSFEFLFSLALLFFVLLLYGCWPTIHIVAFPVLLLVLGLFTMAVSFPLAALVPFVPDLSKPIQYGLRLAFYMSGVMYYVADLPERAQKWLRWNPALHIIEAFRAVLLDASWPDWNMLLAVVIFSLLLGVFGVAINRKMDPNYAKRVTS